MKNIIFLKKCLNKWGQSREKVLHSDSNTPLVFRIVDMHIAEADDFIKNELKKNKKAEKVFFYLKFFI